MKNNSHSGSVVFCLALVGLFLSSACSRQAEFEPSSDGDAAIQTDEEVEYPYTIAIAPDTKSVFDNNHLTWEGDDRVGVLVNGYHRPGNLYTDVSPRIFKFYAPALSEGDVLYAYAPYSSAAGTNPSSVTLTLPSEQFQVENIFDGSSLPMVAIPTAVEAASETNIWINGRIHFCNLAALVRFRIYSTDPAYTGSYGTASNVYHYVSDVSFALTEGAGICGSGTLDMTGLTEESGDEAFLLSGATGTSVRTRAAVKVGTSKDDAAEVYMALLPGTWSGTLTVTTVWGEFTYTLTDKEFERNKTKTFNVDLAHAATKTAYSESNVQFAEVRAQGTATLTDDMFGKDEGQARIYGVILADGGNPNMDQNLQYGTTVDGYQVTTIDKYEGAAPNANNIYTTENDRTNYLQEGLHQGQYGYRLKFDSPKRNVFKRGDKVYIWLNGVRQVKETAPDRYTLVIGPDTRMIKIDRWSEATLTSNSRYVTTPQTIAGLTSDAIYTNVKIKDVEFQIKRGAYANVREYDAIANPVNKGLYEGVNQARKAKDGAANLLYDKDNDGIYMLLNMNCDWRWDAAARTRKQVPQGTGSIKGVLVHQEMERWGGNIGTYSIRPMSEEDIAIDAAPASNWKDLVEWTFTKKTWSIGQYSWNAATSATGGYITSGKYTDAQVVQEVLNATTAAGMTNNTGSVARLYTDNLKMYQNLTSSTITQYPIKPSWGYRGLNVSDYATTTITNNVDQEFGMSAGSIIEFLVNYTGFYKWTNGTWNPGDDVYGIVAEFSTSGISGSEAAISFSIAGGSPNRDNANNISWHQSHSFPIDWAVEYATSDDGTSWSSWTGAVNAATGETGFELRAMPFAITTTSPQRASFHSTSGTQPFYTNSDNGFGLVPYRFVLPGSILGKTKVKVRLVPTSLRMATWNAGSGNWNKGLYYAGESITEIFEDELPHNGSICLEDVLIQYK